MNNEDFESARQHQHSIQDQAQRSALFKNALPLHDKKARYPGFRQGKTIFRAGHQTEPGALPLRVDIILHESVPMQLSDGTTLYSDIYLPASFQDIESRVPEAERVPSIIAWSPYGKQKGTTLLDDFPMRAGVPKHHVSGLQKWEAPDPAYWCARDYAVVNVDIRGAYSSEGDLLIFGHQEAEDGAEFVTYVSEQPWCNSKVALAGNSWLAIAQWRIAGLRPKGLAAIAPWEGLYDFYPSLFPGGIFFPGFHRDIERTFASQGRLEDLVTYGLDHGMRDHYWDDKRAHPEQINVPAYVVASWTNPIHTTGTLEAWQCIPDTVPKWLRVHNKQEWSDFYADSSQKDLERFFDYYLKGRTNNGWTCTPKIRLSVLNFGLTDKADSDVVNRAEAEFPLQRTDYRRYYLQSDKCLSLNPKKEETLVSYDSKSGKQVFRYKIPQDLETTGYFMAHLVMSCPEHTEMDVFVQVEKLSSTGHRQGVLCIKPPGAIARRILKFIHDWNIPAGGAGMAFHWGPDGALRASHALDKDETESRIARPSYAHRIKVPLAKGEVRTLDIPMRPYGMFWEKGDILQLTVQGTVVIPFPIPGLEQHHTDNVGQHVIHCGGDGTDSSYLLVPHV